MTQRNKYVLLAIVIIAIAPLSLYFLNSNKSDSTNNVSLEQRQKQFIEYVDTVQLQDKTPVLESSSPLCSSSNNDRENCTLSKTFIYKLDGNYRDNGKAIFAYLKAKGFDFRQNSKYKAEVEQKLNNTKLADNLSNSEPIIVDLYNSQSKTRVRVNLGDYGRTMPYAKGQDLDQLPTSQLIAGLQFYNP